MRVGILTGGGDAPGLNAVIYGALLRAYQENDIEVVGIKKGWKVFDIPMEELTPETIAKYIEPLNIEQLENLQAQGGTIIYSTRTNPFKDVAKCQTDEEKDEVRQRVGEDLASKFEVLGIDALIAAGGDDTCGVAAAMYKYANAKVVGCPKTIDNDLAGTDFTFGFFTGAQIATDLIENLRTTAESHQRIFVVEVMGRDAGWLTLYSGLGSNADIILLPEMPFNLEKDIIEVLKSRVQLGHKSHIIACSEGAFPTSESIANEFVTLKQEDIDNLPKDAFGNPKLTELNIAGKLEKELKERKDLKALFEENNSEYEIRSAVLGHNMRSGPPKVFDRVTGMRFGWHAMGFVINGDFGKLASLSGTEIVPVDLVKGSQKKYIDPESDLIKIKNAMTAVKYHSKSN